MVDSVVSSVERFLAHAWMRGWRRTSARARTNSTGTMVSNSFSGRCMSNHEPSSAPARDAGNLPLQSVPLSGQLTSVAPGTRNSAGDEPDRVGHGCGHGRHAEGDQRRERDQRSTADHGVDRARADTGQQDEESVESTHSADGTAEEKSVRTAVPVFIRTLHSTRRTRLRTPLKSMRFQHRGPFISLAVQGNTTFDDSTFRV